MKNSLNTHSSWLLALIRSDSECHNHNLYKQNLWRWQSAGFLTFQMCKFFPILTPALFVKTEKMILILLTFPPPSFCSSLLLLLGVISRGNVMTPPSASAPCAWRWAAWRASPGRGSSWARSLRAAWTRPQIFKINLIILTIFWLTWISRSWLCWHSSLESRHLSCSFNCVRMSKIRELIKTDDSFDYTHNYDLAKQILWLQTKSNHFSSISCNHWCA